MRILSGSGFAVGVRATRFALRRVGFRRTVSLLGSVPTPLGRRRPDPVSVRHWADRIAAVGGRPYGATCLDRSVFLWFLMRQRGLDGRIRIGVAFDPERRLDGHAWVEFEGRVVNDAPDVAQRFEVFDEDPIGLVFS